MGSQHNSEAGSENGGSHKENSLVYPQAPSSTTRLAIKASNPKQCPKR